MTSLVKHFKDIGFTAVATPQDCYAEFKVYQHAGENENGDPLFEKAGALM